MADLRFGVKFVLPHLTVAEADLRRKIGEAQRQWAAGVITEAAAYPAERPGQRYRRTGDLGRGWDVDGPKDVGGQLLTQVTNRMKYSKFVHGDQLGRYQSWFHAGRWKKLREMSQKRMPEYRRRMVQAVDDHIRANLVSRTV